MIINESNTFDYSSMVDDREIKNFEETSVISRGKLPSHFLTHISVRNWFWRDQKNSI